MSNTAGYVPPDPTIAAGTAYSNTYLLEGVNLTGGTFDTGGALDGSFDFSTYTPSPSSDSVSDPRVLYDSSAGRWLFVTTTFSGSLGWNIGVSTSSDPTQGFYVFHVSTALLPNPDGSTGNFPDFPKIGFNGNKVVVTGDAYTTSGTFEGTEFVVLNKSELESGGPLCANLFTPPEGSYAIEPALHLAPTGTTTSPTDNLYMAAVNAASITGSSSTLDVWTVTGLPVYDSATGTCNGAASVTITSLPINTMSIPPNAAQEGTSVTLDTNDYGLLDAVFRDGSPGSLWVSGNDACVPPGDTATRSCARFIEVSIDNGSMSVSQDFDYSSPGMYYYFPAVRTDSSGDLVTVFTGSSSSTYASVYTAMRLAGDPIDTFDYFSLVQAGSTPYTVSPPRWGDYSGAGIDPNDSTIWIAGEYAEPCSGFISLFVPSCWGTAIASVTPANAQ